MGHELSDRELVRYSRQLILPELGAEGQMKLKGASVLVIGAGALGVPAAGYLAAAGVGRLGVADGDTVELSNLHRQILHFTADEGTNKAEGICAKLGLLNPEVLAQPYPVRVEQDNAAAIVAGFDVIVDCCDNLETRYLVNDACVKASIALVESGVVGTGGLVTTVIPGESACYRCIFPEQNGAEVAASCEEEGILGPVAGVAGSIQALEAIKLITGIGAPLMNRVLRIDGADLSFTTVVTKPNPDCKICSQSSG